MAYPGWEPGNLEEEGISFDHRIHKGVSEEVAFELGEEGMNSLQREPSRIKT